MFIRKLYIIKLYTKKKHNQFELLNNAEIQILVQTAANNSGSRSVSDGSKILTFLCANQINKHSLQRPNNIVIYLSFRGNFQCKEFQASNWFWNVKLCSLLSGVIYFLFIYIILYYIFYYLFIYYYIFILHYIIYIILYLFILLTDWSDFVSWFALNSGVETAIYTDFRAIKQ
jgi:hypothetical protein